MPPKPRPREPLTAEQNKLLEEHLDLVKEVLRDTRRSIPTQVTDDDLMQGGRDGLEKAVRRYNPQIGTPFRKWAFSLVKFEMKSHARSESQYGKRAVASYKAHKSLEEKRSNGELSTQSFLRLQADLSGPIQLVPLDAQDELPVQGVSPETAVHEIQRAQLVRDAIEELQTKERQAIRLVSYEEKTFSEAAKEMGVDTSRTFRLVKQGTKVLNAILRRKEGGQ